MRMAAAFAPRSSLHRGGSLPVVPGLIVVSQRREHTRKGPGNWREVFRLAFDTLDGSWHDTVTGPMAPSDVTRYLSGGCAVSRLFGKPRASAIYTFDLQEKETHATGNSQT